ncbi:hypothetical protein RLOC_00010492, partial [Lonchura striata]
MDSVFVPENGYLDLLHSDIDPLHLCTFFDTKSSGDEEGDFSTGHDSVFHLDIIPVSSFFANVPVISWPRLTYLLILLTLDLEVEANNYEQLNNVDFPYENGDGFYPCCNTTDAYAKIAELVEYVLKDQQEKQVEDTFAGNLILDDIAAENTEKFPDIKIQSCLKRTFLGSAAESYCDASEPKYKKIVEVPAASAGNGSFFAMPLNSHPVNCTSLSNQYMSCSVPAAHGLERSLIIPGLSEPLTTECQPVSVKGYQENLGLAGPPQQIFNFVLENGTSDV